MNWLQIKQDIVKSLNSRGLKNPSIRINALNRIEEYLNNDQSLKVFIQNPSLLKQIDKNDFKARIAQQKDTGILNSAEESVINEIFYRIT